MKLKSDGVYFEVPGLICWVEKGIIYAADDQKTQKYGRATKKNLENVLEECRNISSSWQREMC